MAVEQCTTIPIEIIRHESGTITQYIGSKEQLIAAGFADESYFPEGRKRIKWNTRGDDDYWYVKKLKEGRYKLRRHHEYAQPAKKKEDFYDSPESFKELAFNWVEKDGRSFEMIFGGESEQLHYGEITMKLDDQSVKEIASVITEMSARLTALVSAAKVVRVRPIPHLSIVK